ncbi:hypothetical protein POG22_16060 [Geitlerinema sp. CS-897]|nr:hypothetical protein [Geitlerinema sp. CS-897]
MYCLTNGEYRQQENSTVLPLLNCSKILNFLNASQTQGETRLIREFRRSISDRIQ